MTDDLVSFDDFFGEEPSSGGPTILEAVHLSSTPAQVAFFTREGASAVVHYLTPLGYFHCVADREANCLACVAGLPADKKLLLPVYDLTAGAVKVLRVPRSVEPHSLFAHLKPRLNAADVEDQACEITRNGNRFTVSDLPLNPATDLGADRVKAFLGRLARNEVSLGDCITNCSNRELADVPEIVNRVTTRGIDINAWLAATSTHADA